jgi:hypothetical protein
VSGRVLAPEIRVDRHARPASTNVHGGQVHCDTNARRAGVPQSRGSVERLVREETSTALGPCRELESQP